MRIAIIGGGAAGMATAYLLNRHHHITLFEKEAILGGNIRTLNKNVNAPALDKEVVLDNGVIEFQRDHFPHFRQLMADLEVETEEVDGGSSTLFLANGRTIQAPGAIARSHKSFLQRWLAHLKLLPFLPDHRRLLAILTHTKHHDMVDKPIAHFFKNGPYFVWQKLMLMYGYSIPYPQIDQFPAEIALPLLNHSGLSTAWLRIKGGVYTYIEKILTQFKGDIHCGAIIQGVSRQATDITLHMAGGETLNFDKIIFATTPDQVLKLLLDPTEAEIRRFSAWQPNHVETVIHTDTAFYHRFGVDYYTEFDVFEKDKSGNGGYNAYLNRLCGQPERQPHYSLAYNLRDWLNPDKIIQIQPHATPLYTVDAIRYRQEVIATNGENHTYHVGAYLGNGLHEGAICSAYNLAFLLGTGKSLSQGFPD